MKVKTNNQVDGEFAVLDNTLENFPRINLKELGKAALMNREETKYVMTMNELLDVLSSLKDDYFILDVAGHLRGNYATVYFDTPEFELYHKHHNGLLNRHKVRTREYLDSDLSFIEVKFKNNKSKTDKKRAKINGQSNLFDETVQGFVQKGKVNWDNLSPVLYNHYTRITLVSKATVERVTIDFNLSFFDKNSERKISIPNLVIAEIKQEKYDSSSKFIQMMHEKMIRPLGFSKYCIGVSLLYDNVKKNNFKEKLLVINKMGGVKEE